MRVNYLCYRSGLIAKLQMFDHGFVHFSPAGAKMLDPSTIEYMSASKMLKIGDPPCNETSNSFNCKTVPAVGKAPVKVKQVSPLQGKRCDPIRSR